MRIAFYAPMKAPSHPVPSGDRAMARQLLAALDRAGHRVDVASTFSSYCGDGDGDRQRRLAEVGEKMAERLLRRYRAGAAPRPEAWLTYHVYHKAPDWLGPLVSRRLDVPYLIAEASHAPKQAQGPWNFGLNAAAQSIRLADAVLGINSADTECLWPLLSTAEKFVPLKPFIDGRRYAEAVRRRPAHRRALVAKLGLPGDAPLLMTTAMMRSGDKLRSYQILAAALGELRAAPWRLLVAGDGDERDAVHATFATLRDRVTWLGRLGGDAVAPFLAAADLFVWPAVGEAYGIALLEAQAAGLPVVAGNEGGVGDVVLDGVTGLLTPPRDVSRFAAAVAALLADPARRRRLGRAAGEWVARERNLDQAASVLDRVLRRVVQEKSSRQARADGAGVSGDRS